MKNPQKIAEPTGKLGILLVGMGAVSTTTIAGVLAVRRGLAKPIGSLTQMGTIRLGKRTEARSPLIDLCAAVQPIAVGKESRQKHITNRLLQAIRSSESRDRFEASGFRWGAP